MNTERPYLKKGTRVQNIGGKRKTEKKQEGTCGGKSPSLSLPLSLSLSRSAALLKAFRGPYGVGGLTLFIPLSFPLSSLSHPSLLLLSSLSKYLKSETFSNKRWRHPFFYSTLTTCCRFPELG